MLYKLQFINSTTFLPITGLSPQWTSLTRVLDGVSVPYPTISDLGGGYYGFILVSSTDLTGVVDGGVILEPADRYINVDIDIFSDSPAIVTLKYLRDSVLDRVLEHPGIEINLLDEDIDKYINSGYRLISEYCDIITDTREVRLVPGQSKYHLSANTAKIYEIAGLTRVPLSDLSSAEGTPSVWAMAGISIIQVSPVPSSAVIETNIQYNYRMVAPKLTEDTDMLISDNELLSEAIVDYALFRVFDRLPMFDKGQVLSKKYITDFESKKIRLSLRIDDNKTEKEFVMGGNK